MPIAQTTMATIMMTHTVLIASSFFAVVLLACSGWSPGSFVLVDELVEEVEDVLEVELEVDVEVEVEVDVEVDDDVDDDDVVLSTTTPASPTPSALAVMATRNTTASWSVCMMLDLKFRMTPGLSKCSLGPRLDPGGKEGGGHPQQRIT